MPFQRGSFDCKGFGEEAQSALASRLVRLRHGNDIGDVETRNGRRLIARVVQQLADEKFAVVLNLVVLDEEGKLKYKIWESELRQNSNERIRTRKRKNG